MNNESGLYTKERTLVPLTGVKVEGEIVGRGACVRVIQRFINREDQAVEAVYRFPLPEGSAVCGFTAVVDGRKISGEVEEREKAFEVYDKALEQGDGGYLLDEERPNIFTLSVGNLPPGKEAVLEISYVTMLESDDGKTRFSLPTTISPRYIPKDMEDDRDLPVDGVIHPPYAADVPYGLSIRIDAKAGGPFRSVESPSHPIRVEQGERGSVSVTFSHESVRMDRDFVLYLEHEGSGANQGYMTRVNGETFVQVDLVLEKEKGETVDKNTGQECIFLVDCSGSMGGDSIAEARRAVEICLRALPPGSFFNVYRFGSTFEQFFEGPTEYTEESLENALSRVRIMDADLGGTEILAPLQSIVETRGQGRLQVFILTDGEVGNEEEILRLVHQYREDVRCFPIGIGAGCNEYFIKGVARAGKGLSEFIYPGERIEPKVLKLFGSVMGQEIVEPVIQWGETRVDQAPADIVLIPGRPVSVFGKILKGGKAGLDVTVSGKDGRDSFERPIEFVETNGEDSPIPALWARERIRMLEEREGEFAGRGSRQKDRKEKKVNEAIIGLSKKYGILSRLTSYMAIEEREEKDKSTGEILLRRVPALVTVGWHGRGSVFGVHTLLASRTYPGLEKMRVSSNSVSAMYDMSYSPDRMLRQSRVDYSSKRDENAVLREILTCQEWSGGLALDAGLAALLGLNLEEIEEKAAEIQNVGSEDPWLVISSAILLNVLEICFGGERDQWVGVTRKTSDWMRYVIAVENPLLDGMPIMAWAEHYVRKTNVHR